MTARKPVRATRSVNGWRTCARGHKYRGKVCGRCWPAGAAKAKK